MIRLLAPHQDVDLSALFDAFPALLIVNEVDCAPENVDKMTPAGRWLAGYFEDGTEPSSKAWAAAVAGAPAPPPPVDLDALRAKVAAAQAILVQQADPAKPDPTDAEFRAAVATVLTADPGALGNG